VIIDVVYVLLEMAMY